jgi:coproporphyrinogen III oxidase-like Fe-S oxidoreductase
MGQAALAYIGFALEEAAETVYSYPNWDVAGFADCDAALRAFPGATDGPTALYVHVPYCVSLCQFCGFTKTDRFTARTLRDFVSALSDEIDLICERTGASGRAIDAVYFGGGTASVLSARHVERILQAIRRRFSIHPDAEWSFEGECRTLAKPEFLEALAGFGFDRISYGVQTLSSGARRALNLRPSAGDLENLARRASDLFSEVTVDFIFGWPGQSTRDAVEDAVEVCSRIAPSSIEVFQFEKGDASPFFLQGLYRLGVRDVTPDEVRNQRREIVRALDGLGYEERTYTLFAARGHRPPARRAAYGPCFYGYGNANVLGFGRGAQSFYGGKMWGYGGEEGLHQEMVASGRIPATVAGTYADFEREGVSWPRRGWIAADVVSRLQSTGIPQKLTELERGGIVRRDGERYVLTQVGREHVPSLILYLMPEAQRALYERDFIHNASGRTPVPQ